MKINAIFLPPPGNWFGFLILTCLQSIISDKYKLVKLALAVQQHRSHIHAWCLPGEKINVFNPQTDH
jgi:hypothetical protein